MIPYLHKIFLTCCRKNKRMGRPLSYHLLTGLRGIVPQNQRRAVGDLGSVQKEQTGESGVKIERKMHLLEKRVTPLFSDCLTVS